MGTRLSIMAPSAPTVAISSYIDVLAQYQFIEILNNCRFLKTIKAMDTLSSTIVIIKLFIKPYPDMPLGLAIETIAADCRRIMPLPCTLPWLSLFETDRAGYMIRQMAVTNLYDRLSLRPFLTTYEKDFLVFQMLMIVKQIHNCGIFHGDIKLENFLVTSWNWLIITDFSAHIKPVYLPEDNPSEFSFFFDSSNRRACYIAPERFFSSKNQPKNTHKAALTAGMDLFSMGCAIIELYADGEPAFTLSQLFQFLRGDYTVGYASIESLHMRHMVASLLSPKSCSRPLANELLHEYRAKCFPTEFYTFLYDYIAQLNNDDLFNCTGPDLSNLKMNHLYNTFGSVVEGLGLVYTSSGPDGYHEAFVPLYLNIPGIPANRNLKAIRDYTLEQDRNPACLILLGVVFSLIKSISLIECKIMACNLVLALSDKIDNEHRLDRSLPYLCYFIDEYTESLSADVVDDRGYASPKVVCFAITSITTLLDSCTAITPLNALVFSEYVLPKVVTLLTSAIPDTDKTMIESTLAACLPHLAITALRFWNLAQSFTTSDANTRLALAIPLREQGMGDVSSPQDSLTIPRAHLVSEFENITLSLLWSSSPAVKVSLLSNIKGLCQCLGVDKTNDVILPHLITFLNDPNYQVRIAFLSAVLQIGPIVGVLSFEQYILPLLVQTLYDPEQLVVIKVLQVFHNFVVSRLINPQSQFNALVIYQGLLHRSAPLLLHPNEWIRQSVLHLFLAISKEVSDADKYCFIFPIFKTFLAYDTDFMTWNNLYPALTKPLTRRILDAASRWSLQASPKSLFWKNQDRQDATRLVYTSRRRVVSFSKSMGKSVYLPPMSTAETPYGSVPLSADDKLWILQLKSLGLSERDSWKLLVLRPFIYHTSRIGTRRALNEPTSLVPTTFAPVQELPIEITYRIQYNSQGVDVLKYVNYSTSSQAYDTLPLPLSLVIPGLLLTKTLVQTIGANAFGELDTSHLVAAELIKERDETDVIRRVVCTAKDAIIVASIRYVYSQRSPCVLDFLETLDLKPTLDDFHEFGLFMKRSKESRRNNSMIKGQVITRFRAGNRGILHIDGVRLVATSSTMPFFVTASDSGSLQVWDASSVDVLTNIRQAALTYNTQSHITSMSFVPNRNALVVTSIDGKILVLRLWVSWAAASEKLSFEKICKIRSLDLNLPNDGYITAACFQKGGPSPNLLCITSRGRLLGFDVGCGTRICSIQIPPQHGNAISIAVGNEGTYALLGTDSGILHLVDLRLDITTRCWQLKRQNHEGEWESVFKIQHLELLLNDCLVIADGIGPDITIWDVPSFRCEQVLSPNEASYKHYTLHQLDVKNECESLSSLLEALDVSYKSPEPGHTTPNVGVTAQCVSNTVFTSDIILGASFDLSLHLWSRPNTKNTVGFEYFFKQSLPNKIVGAITDTYPPGINTMMANLKIQLETPTDIITAMGFIQSTPPMLVVADRAGYFYVFR